MAKRYTFFGFGPLKPDPNNDGKMGYEWWMTSDDGDYPASYERLVAEMGEPTFTEQRTREE